MSIFDLNSFLNTATGKRFDVSQRLESAVLSLFDRENSVTVESSESLLVSRTGPYLNIDLNKESFDRLLQHNFTIPPLPQKNGRFWIEYFSPNIAKQLHIGHIRNVNTGVALQNLLKLQYSDLVFDSHTGDWGIQFGVLLWSIQQLQTSNKAFFEVTILDETIRVDQSLLATDPASYYTYLYVWGNQQKEKIHNADDEIKQIFLQLTQGDAELSAQWQAIVESCSEANAREVRMLNMPEPDYVLGESYYEKELHTLLTFLEKYSFLQSEGKARYLDFAQLVPEHISEHLHSALKSVVGTSETHELGRGYWISSTGYSTYLSRDITARIVWARDYGVKHALTITDSSQSHHMKQVMLGCAWLATLPEFVAEYGQDVADLLKANIEHIGYGRVVLKSGKMSTRKGNFITAQDVIDSTLQEATTILKEKSPSIDEETLRVNAEAITRAAIKWNDLRSALHQDSTFDLHNILSFEGNTGVYQLYTYARLRSITKKAVLAVTTDKIDSEQLSSEEKTLLRYVYCTPVVLLEAAEKREPHRLVNWLTKFAQLTNSWYAKNSVLNEPNPVRQSTLLALIQRMSEMQAASLQLLGIDVVESL